MSILAPIMALVSAVVPIGVGFASGERLSLVGYLGPVVELLAIVLICFVRMSATVSLAGRVSGNSDFITEQLTTMPNSTSEPAAGEMTPSRWRAPTTLAAYSGLTDATACVLFLIALRLGDLSVVSVLDARSPAGTIVLAVIILKERTAPVQWAGLVVALTAAAMLALA